MIHFFWAFLVFILEFVNNFYLNLFFINIYCVLLRILFSSCVCPRHSLALPLTHLTASSLGAPQYANNYGSHTHTHTLAQRGAGRVGAGMGKTLSRFSPGRVCNKLINARLASNWRLCPWTLSSNGRAALEQSSSSAVAAQ